jgi:hypothetical protein
VTDLGFVLPDQYGGPDIICHRNASPASLSAKVEAGGTVELQWTGWPESHHGPVIDYLANCHGSCAVVDKTSLKFNKIDQAGLYSNSTTPWTVGRYASDKLIADGNKWTVTIPSYVAPGNYVLRHEIIALHSAYDPNGAQNYPQCINLEITGKGTDDLPSGTPGESLYTADEPGILVKIYQDIDYIIPGPPLYKPGQAESSATRAAPSTEEPASITPSSVPLATSTTESPGTGSIPTSSTAPTAVPVAVSAGREPVVSASSYPVPGNYSAPLASGYQSGSVIRPTGFASGSLAPKNTSAPITRAPYPIEVPKAATSVLTATIEPTPSAGPVVSEEEGSSPTSTPDVGSTSTSTPDETPKETPEEADVSTTEIVDSSDINDNGTSSPTTGSSSTNSGTTPANVTESSDTSLHSTLQELLNLLEKTIKRLRKKLLGRDRKHARDIVHHWKSH